MNHLLKSMSLDQSALFSNFKISRTQLKIQSKPVKIKLKVAGPNTNITLFLKA